MCLIGAGVGFLLGVGGTVATGLLLAWVTHHAGPTGHGGRDG